MSSINISAIISSILLSFPIGLVLGSISCVLHKRTNMRKQKMFVLSTIWWWYLAFVLYSTLFSRDNHPYTSTNLIPFKDLFHTFYFFDTDRILLIALNFVLFIPIGGLLAIQLQDHIFYKSIPLFCFSVSFFIEMLQYMLKLGIADINDLILNLMGGVWGWNLHKCFVLRKYNYFSLTAFIVPIIICFITIGYHIIQPYGKTIYDVFPTDSVSVGTVSYSSNFNLDSLRSEADIYKLSENNKDDAKNMINLIFNALDTSIAEKIPYDDCCVCYSQNRTFCLWYYYRDQHFELLNFSHNLTDIINPTSLTDIYNFFNSIGISLPSGLEHTTSNESIIVKANLLSCQNSLYDGNILFHMTDGFIDSVSFQVTELQYDSSAPLISTEQIYNLINDGKFYCFGLEAINQLTCQNVELIYALDSKKFYRPYFEILATADGNDITLLIDALA